MTFLSATHSSRIRNRLMGVLYLIAADESCEMSDILALLPQPSSQAPAARVSGPAAPDTQAEVSAPQASADPLPDHFPDAGNMVVAAEPQPPSTPAVQARPVDPSSRSLDGVPTSLPGADLEEQERAIETGKSGEAPASPAPVKPPSRRDTLRALVAGHPDWTAKELASAMGIGEDNVRSIASQISLKLPKASTKAERKKAATTEALKAAPAKPQEPVDRAGPPTPRSEAPPPPAAKAASRDDFDKRLIALHQAEPTLIRPQLAERLGVKRGQVNAAVARLELPVPHARASNDEPFEPEVIPPANPQIPVAPPPTGEGRTLTERVRALHQQHPTWTARLIANELGANPNSVSALLAGIRNPKTAPKVEKPEFTGRRQMVEHYGEIAKRLGKPS